MHSVRDRRAEADCVVIDTNIWRSQLLLNTPTGVSLVYALGRQGGYIGIPEVVERELATQVVQAGLEAVGELQKPSRIIEALTGRAFGPLPTEADLRTAVDARITELSPILVRVPFTLEHARAALDMVVAKLPPNGSQNQQFKDSAIWQAVLDLSSRYNVHFITNDRAFLLDRTDPSGGLAPNLHEDCTRLGGSVCVHCDLGSCLRECGCGLRTAIGRAPRNPAGAGRTSPQRTTLPDRSPPCVASAAGRPVGGTHCPH